MIGAIVGDVLGSYYETWSTKTKQFDLFQELDRCTDDSVLTLAIGTAILQSDHGPTVNEYAQALRLFGNRYPSAGYGGKFKAWLADQSMGPYDSWGNGSAMRCSPVGWAFETEEEVLLQAELSAMPTHNHPEGVKGAQAVALAVFLARRGVDKNEIRKSIQDRFGYDLERRIEDIRPDYDFGISCQDSVPEAIIAFLESVDFEDAVRNAISLGGDADTQACIAGAIAEAHYGDVPAALLGFVLPRMDNFLLDAALAFLGKHGRPDMVAALEREHAARVDGARIAYVPGSDHGSPEPPYRVIMSTDTWKRVGDLSALLGREPEIGGAYLREQIEKLPVPRVDPQWLLVALLNTKKPRIFAESEVIGDGSDWTMNELGILGDISIAVPVIVFDDGLHYGPAVHTHPLSATLLYVPGALFRHGSGGTPADWAVVRCGRVNRKRYDALYERRLLPLLRYASTMAVSRGRKAFITIPGLGCGQFAGRFGGTLGVRLREAIAGILSRHAGSLPGVRAVWFDPYSECGNERREIEHISYFVRPLKKNYPQKPQLCLPTHYAEAGDDFSDCELFSVVAWDHVSWPGNDFYDGARSTDDGVKAAATDSMFALTAVRGTYSAATNSYDPPDGFTVWEDVILRNSLKLRAVDNVVMVGTPEGIDDDLD